MSKGRGGAKGPGGKPSMQHGQKSGPGRDNAPPKSG